MKTRTGFVSNSSSSSFVASLDRLSKDEIDMIMEYQTTEENTDHWHISENHEKGLLEGWTSMDNGVLEEWLEKKGINKVRFDGGY